MRDAQITLASGWHPTLGQLAQLRLGGDGLVYSGENVVGRWEFVDGDAS